METCENVPLLVCTSEFGFHTMDGRLRFREETIASNSMDKRFHDVLSTLFPRYHQLSSSRVCQFYNKMEGEHGMFPRAPQGFGSEVHDCDSCEIEKFKTFLSGDLYPR